MSHSETLSPLGLAPPVLQNIRHLEAYSWGLILGHPLTSVCYLARPLLTRFSFPLGSSLIGI